MLTQEKVLKRGYLLIFLLLFYCAERCRRFLKLCRLPASREPILPHTKTGKLISLISLKPYIFKVRVFNGTDIYELNNYCKCLIASFIFWIHLKRRIFKQIKSLLYFIVHIKEYNKL